MPTSYPDALDSFVNPAGSSDTAAGVTHSAHHSNANDAIEAIEAKLGIGAGLPGNGKLLVGNAAAGSSRWLTVPSARIYHDAPQSIASGSSTILSFNQTRYDTDAMRPTTTGITIKTAGRYAIGACVSIANNATGYRAVFVNLNGANILSVVAAAVNGADTRIVLSGDYACAVNDLLQVAVLQNSGGPLNVVFTNYYTPDFWAHWIGA